MNRQRAALAISVAAGIGAALATWSYLGNLHDRAYRGAALVPVLVVEKDIPQGQTGEQVIAAGAIRSGRTPRDNRPAQAVTDISAIRGQVALVTLFRGEILAAGLFGPSAGRAAPADFSRTVPSGQVAVTVQVDAVHGVANLIGPGDKVDILLVTAGSAQVLYQGVTVIALGSTYTAAGTADGSQPAPAGDSSGLVTFAVPSAAAQKIALAATSSPGAIYLTLPGPNPSSAPPPLSLPGLLQGSVNPYSG